MGSLIWTDNYFNQIIFKKSEFGFIPEEIRNYSKNKSKYYLGLYRIHPNFDIVPRGVVTSFRNTN
ncbi:hypothetical protein BpHYR1_046147 [Brachionus plicatilis]|uniref:Uncharacterized protein n=1 Tax=Brachionus plicatilis TaxID=10195 RepID=A0A3M7R3C3_BRAPC|nr:hypothetical protein BpHYR1_046147 [Brachionus plicatilis]